MEGAPSAFFKRHRSIIAVDDRLRVFGGEEEPRGAHFGRKKRDPTIICLPASIGGLNRADARKAHFGEPRARCGAHRAPETRSLGRGGGAGGCATSVGGGAAGVGGDDGGGVGTVAVGGGRRAPLELRAPPRQIGEEGDGEEFIPHLVRPP